MPERLRKLIGTVVLVSFICFYALTAMTIAYGGLYEQQQESFRSLLLVLAIAAAAVVAVLLFQLRSWARSVAVIAAAPLGLAGGAATLLVTIKGVLYLPLSALRVASIALRNPANKNHAVALTAKQFRYGFGNALSEAESNELYERWAIPSPGKPLFEAASANISRRSPAKVKTDNATRYQIGQWPTDDPHVYHGGIANSDNPPGGGDPPWTPGPEYPSTGCLSCS